MDAEKALETIVIYEGNLSKLAREGKFLYLIKFILKLLQLTFCITVESWKISLDTRKISTINTCVRYYIGDASQLSKARKRDKSVSFEKEKVKL